jgi:hypothetical protein
MAASVSKVAQKRAARQGGRLLPQTRPFLINAIQMRINSLTGKSGSIYYGLLVDSFGIIRLEQLP